jgi:hypothetical protein
MYTIPAETDTSTSPSTATSSAVTRAAWPVSVVMGATSSADGASGAEEEEEEPPAGAEAPAMAWARAAPRRWGWLPAHTLMVPSQPAEKSRSLLAVSPRPHATAHTAAVWPPAPVEPELHTCHHRNG